MEYRETEDPTRTGSNRVEEDGDVVVERTDARDRPAGDVDPGRVGVERAHDRFGGFDVPAQLTGMLVAIGLVVLLGGIAGAVIGSIAYQTGLQGNLNDISVGALVSGLVVLLVSFLLGGWAAGRIARYDGGRNGLMTAVWFLILTAILAGLGIWFGAEYNVAGRVELPNWFAAWFSDRDVTTAAAVSGLGAVVATLVGGFLGGLWGERYHRRADATIVDARAGTYTSTREVEDARGPR
jgi:MFS family permease